MEERPCYNLESAPTDPELQRHLDQVTPFIFAWRCHKDKTKQDETKLRERLARLSVRRMPTIQVELTLPGHPAKTLDRAFHHHGDYLLLKEGDAGVVNLARALAAALEIRSEANFFENLLRCCDDAERRAKLRAEDIPDDQIDLYIQEFAKPTSVERPAGGQQNSTGIQSPRAEEGADLTCGNMAVKSSVEDNSTPSAPGEVGAPGQSIGSSLPIDAESKRTETDIGVSFQEDGSQAISRPVSLKTPAEHDVEWLAEWRSSSSDNDSKGHSKSEDSSANGELGSSLTSAQKWEIERAGRAFAASELGKAGYSVETMPPGNEGFDLRAMRLGEVLLVEVKGHSGTASFVELTHAERQKQNACCRDKSGERWELWNVERLSRDISSTVRMSRFSEIPDNALRARTYRVDLRKCASLTSP